ncbi:hypothetical protein BVX98_02790 [bacterium F11]|nr:hypothetical protein BVX98_02790 [bacterium F11]
MKKIHLISYDGDMKIWEMTSPDAEGFTTKNFLRGRDLDVTLFEEGEKSSDITSEYGILLTEKAGALSSMKIDPKETDGHKLDPGDMYLKGHVVVISTDGTKLETDWLWFHRKQGLITSTAPVKVTRSDSITKGIGMEATADLSAVTIFNQTLIIKSTDTSNEEI